MQFLKRNNHWVKVQYYSSVWEILVVIKYDTLDRTLGWFDESSEIQEKKDSSNSLNRFSRLWKDNTSQSYSFKYRTQMKFAVIENEFGDVGIDENILVESSQETIIEVMNGCICCTVRGDLTEALDQLYDRIRDFDGVLIETTGLADPAPVAQTFFVDERVTERYKLDGIITVVDAKHVIPHIEDEKPEGIENEAVEQLAFADRIMLNKIDLVSEEELHEVENRIKSINAFAPIFHTENSVIDPKNLIDIGAFDLERTLKMDPEFLDIEAEHEHDERVTSISSKFVGALNVNKLERWIGELMRDKAEDLFRYRASLR